MKIIIPIIKYKIIDDVFINLLADTYYSLYAYLALTKILLKKQMEQGLKALNYDMESYLIDFFHKTMPKDLSFQMK